MAITIKKTKYFYPPRPGNGAGTFSDNIVGLQTVDGGGLTQGNFEFTTSVIDKVNRTFSVGAFQAPVSLSDLSVNTVLQSNIIQSTQFGVHPVFDVSQVLNFSLYGSLAKRFSVSVTNIINYFPAAIDVLYTMPDFSQGNTAVNISYDQVNDETYFEVNIDKMHNPFGIDYSISASTNLAKVVDITSEYRNLYNTYLNYAIVVEGVEYKVVSFLPSQSLNSGYIAFYVSGTPFGVSATSVNVDFEIRPNDFIVDKIFAERFGPVEQFLVNRLIQPVYTALFQVPQQDLNGQFFVSYQQATWPKDGNWNLDIRSFLFDDYLSILQSIAENLDSFKTNLISRFLTAGSLKEFDTMGRKVEKIFQLYGRSFDQLKTYVDGLAFANSVSYNPSNDIPSELLKDLAQTLGWSSSFSPIVNEDFLPSVFGNQNKPTYPGYARAQTPTELNYQFYRNLILNSAYIFKSKGTRRSIEFLLNLIGAPESIVEYNEHVYLADQPINIDNFLKEFSQISGGTYVDEVPAYDPQNIFKLKGVSFTGFTTQSTYTSISVSESEYPFDAEGYPQAPLPTDSMFFQKGAGWYEQTPSHRSPEQIVIIGNVFTGQNSNIQTQLQPFTYGQLYLDTFRNFPYVNEGFKLLKVVDNNKSWLSSDNRLRVSTQGDYNAYYYVDNEKLVLNVKNIDLFLNPAQGLIYDVWVQSREYDYPIPESGLTAYYPVPGGVDSTYINPQPKKKTFFEFTQTFWHNMINCRNRQTITDGKTGGYPTLQSLWWNYLLQYENIDINNNNYTYQKLIDYSLNVNPNWLKLVEQMIPATTIWQGGIKYENSILHRQKFVYRRQRGCRLKPVPVEDCLILSNLNQYNLTNEQVEIYIFPWLNNNIGVSNFNGILSNRLNNLLAANGQTQSTCTGLNSMTSEWYLDLKIGNQVLIHQKFYTGFGPNDSPTNSDWKIALTNYLPVIIDNGLSYNLNGNKLTIINMGTQPLYLNQNLSLNVGININVTC